MLKTLTSFFVLSLVAVQVAGAAILWENDITGTNPNTANPYLTGQAFDALLTVSGIGRGTGIAGTNANDRYNASGWDTAASINLNDYFTFTLAPTAGYEIDFTSFVYSGQASGQGPTSFAVRSSVDGFTSNLGSPSAGGATINLSGGSFQNVTSAIEFRIYGSGATAGAGTFSVNDFTFNGSVAAIPEPTTAVMMLGGMGTVLLFRRRRVN